MKTLKDLGFDIVFKVPGRITFLRPANIIKWGSSSDFYIRFYDDGDVELESGCSVIDQTLAKAIEHEMKKLGWWA